MTNRPGGDFSISVLTPDRAAVAFPIAHDASALVIGTALGSKYWAAWRVRRNLSNVGLAKAGISELNCADTASSTVMCDKGLQFDVVFLPELQFVHGDPKGDDLRMRFYVMTSRARNTLGLMYSGNSVPAIVGTFPMNLLDDRRY